MIHKLQPKEKGWGLRDGLGGGKLVKERKKEKNLGAGRSRQ